jgi:hypothetical protein
MKIQPRVPCTSGSSAASTGAMVAAADGVLLKASGTLSDVGDMGKRIPAASDDDMWVWHAPVKDDAVEPAPADDEPAVEDSWYQILSRLRRKDNDSD